MLTKQSACSLSVRRNSARRPFTFPTTLGRLAEVAAGLSGPALLMVGEAMSLAQASEIPDAVLARVSA